MSMTADMNSHVFLNAYYENCKEREAYNQPKLTQEEYYKIWVEMTQFN